MAGLKKVSKLKVHASSILEVVVSLVLVTIIFAVAMMVYANVMASGISLQQGKGMLQLDALMEETKSQKAYFDEELTLGNNQVTKKVAPYENIQGLYSVQLEMANAEARVIAAKREIVFDPSVTVTKKNQTP